jgi:hypothetical protein
MKPIPEEAMPVVEIIRREAEKPTDLPLPVLGMNAFPHIREHLRWKKDKEYFCPMGLCPKAKRPEPVGPCSFGYEVELFLGPKDNYFENTDAFISWWDSLLKKDAAEAVDAIWPKEIA